MSLSVSSFSKRLNELDPILYPNLEAEITDANRYGHKFAQRVAKIKWAVRGHENNPLVLKKREYCLDYLSQGHSSTCQKCHSIAAFHAFNEIQNPHFKAKICTEWPHKRLTKTLKCSYVHPGEFFHNLPSNAYELYDPQHKYVPKSGYSNTPFSHSSLQQPFFSTASFVPAPSVCRGSVALSPLDLTPVITTSVFVQLGWVWVRPLAPSNPQSFAHSTPIGNFQKMSPEILTHAESVVSPSIGPQTERVSDGSIIEEIGNPDIDEASNAIPETDFPLNEEEKKFVESILSMTFSGVEE